MQNDITFFALKHLTLQTEILLQNSIRFCPRKMHQLYAEKTQVINMQ